MAQMGVDLMIVDFKQKIIKDLNDNILPISVKEQVLKEILSQVENAKERVIQEQSTQYQQELEEEKKNAEEEKTGEAKKALAQNKNSKLKKGAK